MDKYLPLHTALPYSVIGHKVEGNIMPLKRTSRCNKRDTADRRAGPKQGPYVNTGKQPRSRNNDGTWRRKRADAGRSRGK